MLNSHSESSITLVPPFIILVQKYGTLQKNNANIQWIYEVGTEVRTLSYFHCSWILLQMGFQVSLILCSIRSISSSTPHISCDVPSNSLLSGNEKGWFHSKRGKRKLQGNSDIHWDFLPFPNYKGIGEIGGYPQEHKKKDRDLTILISILLQQKF